MLPHTLAAPAERLPQTAPTTGHDDHDHPATPRPYLLRFAAAATPPATPPPVTVCPHSQTALLPDGTPWHRHPTAMEMSTTGASSDGTGSTGGEEWKPDYQQDADLT